MCSKNIFKAVNSVPNVKIASVLAVSHKPGATPPPHATTHAGQIWDSAVVHLGDDTPPTVGAAKIISCGHLSARKKLRCFKS